MKKLEMDYIRKQFEAEGYTLLEKSYLNSKQKLEYICPSGHRHKISWNEWNSGHNRCPYCSGNAKPKFDYVKNSFKAEGYRLLSEEYKNSYTKLAFICPSGHKHAIRWNDWSRGFRCPYCSGKIKKTLEFVAAELKKEDYTLLSKTYKNSKTKLRYRCAIGHENEITWASWSQGKRCPICKSIRLSGERSPHWRGGISCEPYCDAWADKEYKESIKDRDGNTCLNPLCEGKSTILSVHHIDYDKKNCVPGNLIALCASCNSKANKDRLWHSAWYRAVMYRRYGYI